MERSDFDTRSGLMAHIFTREGLHQVLQARADYAVGAVSEAPPEGVAPSSDLPKLNTFCLFGRLILEPCGAVSRVNRQAFTDEQLDRIAEYGPVISWMQLMQFVTQNGVDAAEIVFDPMSSSGGCEMPVDLFNLPPAPGKTCWMCGGGWHLDNIGDYLPKSVRVQSAMDEFVGLTYEEALRQKFEPGGSCGDLLLLRGGDEFVLLKASQAELNDYLLHEYEPENDGALELMCTDDIVLEGDQLAHEGIGHVHASCLRSQLDEALDEARQRLARREQKILESCRGITELFEHFGFDDVRVEQAEQVPQQIIDWMQEDDEDDDDDLVAMSGEFPYLNVSTKQGNVGVFLSVYPMLDLTPAGLTFAELHPEEGEGEPDGFAFVGLAGEDEQMLRLWQLMVEKQQE